MALTKPYSLVSGGGKLIAAATATTTAPVAADNGYNVKNHQFLHLQVELTGGTSADLAMWVKHPQAANWAKFTAYGTAGTKQYTTAAGNVYEVIEVDGIERVFFQIAAVVGPPTLDVWLAANSFD